MATKIEDLLNNDVFTNRHIGSSSAQRQKMLDYLGFDNLDKLIKEIVPDIIRRKKPMNIDAVSYTHLTLPTILLV